jgi:intracellular sulfur oxidation DsrE/DsrF family protein
MLQIIRTPINDTNSLSNSVSIAAIVSDSGVFTGLIQNDASVNSLPMSLKAGSKVASHIAELATQNIRFSACEKTMARKKANRADLVPGADTVPSGLVEIILKQEEGWSYIKGGH